MNSLNDKSNEELHERIISLKFIHDETTKKILDLVEYLETIESEYELLNNELKKRRNK